mmetsp:Transcript_36221/g.75348  ORF Transcript_36221/g.75348 Transcript_36221/m.75348 type:complete len:84 (+) Transcript_36221:2193-2444(+)
MNSRNGMTMDHGRPYDLSQPTKFVDQLFSLYARTFHTYSVDTPKICDSAHTTTEEGEREMHTKQNTQLMTTKQEKIFLQNTYQ